MSTERNKALARQKVWFAGPDGVSYLDQAKLAGGSEAWWFLKYSSGYGCSIADYLAQVVHNNSISGETYRAGASSGCVRAKRDADGMRRLSDRRRQHGIPTYTSGDAGCRDC